MGEQAFSRRAFVRGGAFVLAGAAIPPTVVFVGSADAGAVNAAREIYALYERWQAALVEHGKAEEILFGHRPPGMTREMAKALVDRANDTVTAFSAEMDELVRQFVERPSGGIADLVCKAQLALLTHADVPVMEQIVKQLAAVEGRTHA